MRKYTNSGHKEKFSKIGTSKPARNVSAGIKISVLFGGVLVFIGITFTLVGIGTLIPFAMMVDFSDLKFSDKDPVTNCEITDVRGTNSYSNDIQVFEYNYEFYAEGKKITGKSFQPGNHEIYDPHVQYLKDNPETSRLVGMNNGAFPVWVLLFLLIFPAVGILMLVFGMKKRILYLKILNVGKVTFGTFNRMEATGASVNDNRVYKMFFDFVADDGKAYFAVGETYQTYKLQDETYEPLIYNPANPNEAVMIDSLPASVRKVLSNDIALANTKFNDSQERVF
ncbi:MAG: hypothetical protein JXL97_18335 [Bacteroidales bacterium]|nr:hypothetical protein [Bacteroidales bacterium]